MTNEEIIDTTRGTELWQYYGEEINKLLDLARADEREKISVKIDDLKSEIERLNSALESRKFIGG